MPLPSNLRLNAFKYPIAFIRVIELVFIIIALSSINGWMYKLSFTCPPSPSLTSTPTPEPVKRSVSFTTFSFDAIKVDSCDSPSESIRLWNEGEGFSSSSGFFYFVQSISLVSIFASIFFYVVLWESVYMADGRFRLADLVLTAFCFILFFFCSSIWWSSSNGIGFVGSQEHVSQLLKDNPRFNVTDPIEIETKNSLLTISVLCAWVSVVLYAFNSWYIWKEITPTPSSNPTSIA